MIVQQKKNVMQHIIIIISKDTFNFASRSIFSFLRKKNKLRIIDITKT